VRVLVTRPEDQARATAAALRARGHEPLLDPLLRIEPLPDIALPTDADLAALVVTSRNAVPALGRAPRRTPVACVGAATAAAVRAAGFPVLGAAPGSVAALAAGLRHLLPAGAAVLHLCGEERAAGTEAAFARAGLRYRHLVVYRAVAASELRASTRTALATGRLDAVLLFSPRSAALLCELIRRAALVEAARGCRAVCLSPAVTEAAAALPWRSCVTAAARDQTALLDCLDGPG
jgi:uroporphyrinogen-III synthase